MKRYNIKNKTAWDGLARRDRLQLTPDDLAGRLMTIQPEDWILTESGVKIILEKDIAFLFTKYPDYFMGNGINFGLVTVQSVEYDTNNALVKIVPKESTRGDIWDGLVEDLNTTSPLNLKPLSRAITARPAKLILTLTVDEEFPAPAPENDRLENDRFQLSQLENTINVAIAEREQLPINQFVDVLVDDFLEVTDVDVSPGSAQIETISSITHGNQVEISTSKSGSFTYINIETIAPTAVLYKSQIIDNAVREKIDQYPMFLQLEKMRLQLGREDSDPHTYPYQAIMSIHSVKDGIVKCDREQVLKVLRKKKGGRCIYQVVVDHGNKSKTTHPGEHSDCTIYIDELITQQPFF